MSDPGVGSYQEHVRYNEAQFEALSQNGEYSPLLLHQILIFFCLPIAGLMIPNGANRYIQYIIFSIEFALGVSIIQSYRSSAMGNGYFLGLTISSWLLRSATLLIFTDPQKSFMRIERGRIDDQFLSPKKNQKILDKEEEDTHRLCDKRTSPVSTISTNQQGELKWQSYPQKMGWHRFNWILALFLSVRGAEWNWRIKNLGPLPKQVRDGLDRRASSPTNQAHNSRSKLQSILFAVGKNYVILDMLKMLMIRDPYFWSFVPNSTASSPFISSSPLLIRTYRILTCVTFIQTLLSFLQGIVFRLIPLGFSLAFPRLSAAISAVPYDEAWLYDDLFGSFQSMLDDGLPGVWGQYWHQIYRLDYMSCSRWILSFCPDAITRRPTARLIIHGVVAFSLCGVTHACACYTQLRPTRPISGVFLFFVLQAIGLVLQATLSSLISMKSLPIRLRRLPLKRAFNFVFIFVWFFVTFPLVFDEYARGGLGFWEPVPISPLRGLGGEGWWWWDGRILHLWEGPTRWESGIRFL